MTDTPPTTLTAMANTAADIDELYSKLNTAIEAHNEKLQGTGLFVFTEMQLEGFVLAWRKHNNVWQLVVQTPEDTKTLSSAPLAVRLEALAHMADFVKEMVQAGLRFKAKLENAVRSIDEPTL